jgi:hypothetical protein
MECKHEWHPRLLGLAEIVYTCGHCEVDISKGHWLALDEISGLQSEIAVAKTEWRDLERGYSQRLGEMARLADKVCKWVDYKREEGSLIPPHVMNCCKEIMEYVNVVRPAKGEE